MELEKDKKEPMQNELELEFSTVEPITPKKNIVKSVSWLDKIKALFQRQPEQKTTATSSEQTQSEPPSEAENVATETTEEKPVSHWKKPETWAILSPLPQRHRRLFVALLLLLLLFIFYFLLKPSSHTVTYLEQQNSSAIPIQFQPIDPPQENKEAVENNQNLDLLVNQLQQNEQAALTSPEPATNKATAETKDKVEVKTNVETVAMPSEVITPQLTTSKVETTNKVVPAAKPVPSSENKTPKTTSTQSAQNASSEKNASSQLKSKTLTIPQGVSLMQVFRNQNLNIAEVNAMTKAKGAKNVLSSFKGGDKVKVLLNNKGNVVELQLQNGTKFIRQKDGSYIFKK